jgi:hypothetical protein
MRSRFVSSVLALLSLALLSGCGDEPTAAGQADTAATDSAASDSALNDGWDDSGGSPSDGGAVADGGSGSDAVGAETDAACTAGSEGCSCGSDGTCGDGLACKAGKTCVKPFDCPLGVAGCGCKDGGLCDDPLLCFGGGVGLPTCVTPSACPPGQSGCACVEGACGGGLFCKDGKTCQAANNCPASAKGCPCANSLCGAGLFCDSSKGLCSDAATCTKGVAGCPCDAVNGCGVDLACGATSTCETCPYGTKGCPCGSGCGTALLCDGGKCIDDVCFGKDGTAGCACKDGTTCADGAWCKQGLCKTCEADGPGCSCGANKPCATGLTCKDAVDLASGATISACSSCADNPGAVGCAATADGLCLAGNTLNAATQLCELCQPGKLGCDCTAQNGCDQPLKCNQLSGQCVQCKATSGCPCTSKAECGSGFVCDGQIKACQACALGADGCDCNGVGAESCVDGDYCDPAGVCAPCKPNKPGCPLSCNVEFPSPVKVVGKNTCASCPGNCTAVGETGNVVTAQTGNGTCMCETKVGYFFEATTGKTEPCDADGDGWIRQTALDAMRSKDTAIAANARCLPVLHRVTLFGLVNELGVALPVELTSVLDAATYKTGTLKVDGEGGIVLAEPLLMDDENLLSEAAKKGGFPMFAGARPPHANEINPLTKSCASASADFNGNGIADVEEWSGHPKAKPDAISQLSVKFSYWIELHRGWYGKVPAPVTLDPFALPAEPTPSGLPGDQTPATLPQDSTEYQQCVAKTCGVPMQACTDDADCKSIVLCAAACNGDAACMQGCAAAGTEAGKLLFDAMAQCIATSKCEIAPPPPPPPPPPPVPLVDVYLIAEKSRAQDAAAAFQVALVDTTTEGDYWRSCRRRVATDYTKAVNNNASTLGYDFAKWSFATPLWGDGMTHHSQFRCVVIASNESDLSDDEKLFKIKAEEIKPSDPAVQAKWTANDCKFGQGVHAGLPTDVTQLVGVSAQQGPWANPSEPAAAGCTAATVATGATYWVVSRYQAYLNDSQYVRGCVNECVDAIAMAMACPWDIKDDPKVDKYACIGDLKNSGKALCTCNNGYYGSPAEACTPKCGDGIIAYENEVCDDGNTATNDGCNGSCQCEGGAAPVLAKKTGANGFSYDVGTCQCAADSLNKAVQLGGICGNAKAVDLGGVAKSGTALAVGQGNIRFGETEDWYRIYAPDKEQVAKGTVGTETYDFNLAVTANGEQGNDAFVFDVFRGGSGDTSCSAPALLCSSVSTHQYTNSLKTPCARAVPLLAQPKSPVTTANEGPVNQWSTIPAGAKLPPDGKLLKGLGAQGVFQECANYSAHYYVRVRRAANTPTTCGSYKLTATSVAD